jgi:hypothetical protein
MGTFHPHAHPLHGITCVVDTKGARVLVGRVDTADEREVVLLDVDVHEEAPGAASKDEWVRRTARVGPWRRHARVAVPAGEVASIRRLAEFA